MAFLSEALEFILLFPGCTSKIDFEGWAAASVVKYALFDGIDIDIGVHSRSRSGFVIFAHFITESLSETHQIIGRQLQLVILAVLWRELCLQIGQTAWFVEPFESALRKVWIFWFDGIDIGVIATDWWTGPAEEISVHLWVIRLVFGDRQANCDARGVPHGRQRLLLNCHEGRQRILARPMILVVEASVTVDVVPITELLVYFLRMWLGWFKCGCRLAVLINGL